MTRKDSVSETVTLHVQFRMVKRGGRKEMQLPERSVQPPRADATLVKALARAFRWKRMLESGEFTSITELAERERLTLSFVTRILRLTLLAPHVVEAILDEGKGSQLTLATAMRSFPVEWDRQQLTGHNRPRQCENSNFKILKRTVSSGARQCRLA